MPSGLTGEVIIIPDEVNNAIVVRSNATDYAKIKKTIETLDILPRAVLIEVTLAEVTLNKNFAYGLQWFFRSKEFQTSFGNTLLSSGTTTNADGTTTNNRRFDFAQLAGQGLNLFFLSNSRDFAALINFLSTKTEVNILSTPTLLATDNKEASIQVGGREPVPTGSITGGTTGSDVISTIQYEETGIILNVTPHINAGGLVRLEVEQTDRRTNQVAATVGNNNTAPTFTERNIKTTLLAQSGSTIVIGGIIQQQQTDTRDGIPFLEDIPIISPLFSTKGRSTARTELIIAITPHVVDHRESAVTREFLDKLKQLRREVGRP